MISKPFLIAGRGFGLLSHTPNQKGTCFMVIRVEILLYARKMCYCRPRLHDGSLRT